MARDLILRNARLAGRDGAISDIAISGGKIADIQSSISADAPAEDVGSRLVTAGCATTNLRSSCAQLSQPISAAHLGSGSPWRRPYIGDESTSFPVARRRRA